MARVPDLLASHVLLAASALLAGLVISLPLAIWSSRNAHVARVALGFASLVQTMARSLNTSLTVLFTLSALTLFGGESIRTFTLALLIGVFSGTYSSIFNASMLLVIWEHGELGLWRFNRNRDLPGGRKRRDTREREPARSRG